MVPSSVDELSQLLIALRLLRPEELRPAMVGLPGGASGRDLLQALERQQLLTTFQVQKIMKGDTDALVLGGCKLQYRNASGSFARLYRATRIADDQVVAIKLLRDRWSKDPDTVRLFHREGDIGQRLKHPNIVPIHDVSSQGKYHFISMDFVEGGNLKDFIKIRNKLEPAEACRYALDMSRALAYALGQGVTHRDMKTTNVLMSSQGVAKLIDFGLAAEDSFLNRAGSPDLAQALEYSTLEKNTNAPRNDPRSDLFFLGTILYELLSGEPPYERTRSRDERKNFSRYRDIRPVTSMIPNLSWRVAGIVDRLLQINPEQRYQSPDEVASELESVLTDMGEEVVASTQNSRLPSASNGIKVLLCVEHRPKRQDLLREYFTKHGFRVLLLGDADRALARLKSTPPTALILFGDAIGDRIVKDFQTACLLTENKETAVAAVVAESQQGLFKRLSGLPDRAVVLQQPVKLRELRENLESRIPKS